MLHENIVIRDEIKILKDAYEQDPKFKKQMQSLIRKFKKLKYYKINPSGTDRGMGLYVHTDKDVYDLGVYQISLISTQRGHNGCVYVGEGRVRNRYGRFLKGTLDKNRYDEFHSAGKYLADFKIPTEYLNTLLYARSLSLLEIEPFFQYSYDNEKITFFDDIEFSEFKFKSKLKFTEWLIINEYKPIANVNGKDNNINSKVDIETRQTFESIKSELNV